MEVGDFDSVAKFMERLASLATETTNPDFSRNNPSDTSKYIYRGQADSDWKLIPSWYRKDNHRQLQINNHFPCELPVLEEKQLLKDFIQYCDIGGFDLPIDYAAKHEFLSLNKIQDEKWPFPSIIPLMAMAQHHKLATRLIDFTISPFVAAYFAASSAAATSCDKSVIDVQNKKIAVYALDNMIPTFSMYHDNVRKQGDISYEYNEVDPESPCEILQSWTRRFKKNELNLEKVYVSSAISENIRAQKGLFVLLKNKASADEQFEFERSIDDEVKCFNDKNNFDIERNSGYLSDDILLKKITLPYSAVNELLTVLDCMGINEYTIYPHLDAVVQYIKNLRNRSN